MQTNAEPTVKPLNGVDRGIDRAELAKPIARPKAAPLFASPTVEHRGAKLRKFTVTFYSQSSEPESLPNFSYAVVGTVLGHTKFLAYVEAEDPQHAAYGVHAFFEVAQVDCVDDGHRSAEGAPLRGTVAVARPRGFLSRILGIFGG